MTPGIERPQAREWLDAQIAELATLRNANPRDSGFKQWRQHTLTIIQRIWSDDPAKASSFKRIPFTAPGGKPEREQVRLCFARGCSEALTCLRRLRVILDNPSGEGAAADEQEPAPVISTPPAPASRASAPDPPATRTSVPPAAESGTREGSPPSAAGEPGRGDEHDEVRRAMTDFLTSSPVFAALDRMDRERGGAPRLSPSAFALAAMASELADLGVPAIHRTRARNALNELARHIDQRDLTWEELRLQVQVVMEFPVVARRVLPLLVPFLDEAA